VLEGGFGLAVIDGPGLTTDRLIRL